MDETQTQQESVPKPTKPFDPGEDNMFVGRAADTARNFEFTNETSPTDLTEAVYQPPKPKTELSLSDRILRTGAKVALIAGGSAVLGAGLGAIDNANQQPTYSTGTVLYPVEAGDSLYSIAEEIPGIDTARQDSVVRHIATDPANANVMSDNKLKPGEQLVIPISINGAEVPKK